MVFHFLRAVVRSETFMVLLVVAPVVASAQLDNVSTTINIRPPELEAVPGPPQEVALPSPGLQGLEALVTPPVPYAQGVPLINIRPPAGSTSVHPALIEPPRVDGPEVSSSPRNTPGIQIAPPGGGWQENPASTYNTTNFCGGAHEREVISATCPDRPAYYHNNRRVECAPRTRTNIATRYGSEYENMIQTHVREAAELTGISPALILALLDAESGFNPMASNQGHDTGMAQFQVSTARSTLNYWRQTGSSSVRLQSFELQDHPPSSQCSRRDYPNLSAACRNSLMQESVCGSLEEGLRPNLFCPQFAIYMMAWHLKRTSVSGSPRNILGQSIHISQALQGDGDPVAQARYLASSYNRGCLIENSFVYLLENQGVLASARDYGALWSSPVSPSFTSSSRRPCGTSRVLSTERINRCYIWRVTGLCGGFGDSLVGQYLRANYCEAGSSYESSPAGGVQ